MTRDPRTDPRPGDLLAIGDALLRVDAVVFQRVVGVVFRHGAMWPCEIFDVSVPEWSEATAKAGVVTIPEGDPRWTATILEAR